jgi:hypothetical protein
VERGEGKHGSEVVEKKAEGKEYCLVLGLFNFDFSNCNFCNVRM